MTNDEIKKEVLLRARYIKEKKAKRNRRLFAGCIGLFCVGVSVLLLPTFTPPPVVPTSVNNTHTAIPSETQTVTTHSATHFTTHSATQTVPTTTTPSQNITTQTDTKHSNKGTYRPPTTTGTNAPLPNSSLVLNHRTVYHLATEEDCTNYGIQQAVCKEDIGAYLGAVETKTDAPIYSADPALAGGKVYTYKPVANELALVIVCNDTTLVFIASNTTVPADN